MARVARNLVKLRETHEDMKTNSGMAKRKKSTPTLKKMEADMRAIVDYFKSKAILSDSKRNKHQFFDIKVTKENKSKLDLLVDDIDQASLEHTLSHFIPKLLQQMRDEKPGEASINDASVADIEDEEGEGAMFVDLGGVDPELDSGVLSEEDD
jgi:hypothetical protein